MNAAHDSGTTMFDDASQSDEQPAALDTMLMLPTGTSAADIAAQCRDAAMVFINESKAWSKAELSMWLTGSYASITRHAVKQEEEGTVWPVPLLRDIDVRLIDRIMGSARTEILTTLANIAKDGSASFVLRALIAGTVVRCEDGTGEPAWAPTTAATRLADRVLSLFAVDYLARPIDYETSLFVCTKCESVSFKASQYCETCQPAPRTASLTIPRHTLPYPPLGA
jgi:hypothetical protein